AIPVLLSDPQSAGKIFPLILSKFLIALIAGTVIDISGIFKTSKADTDAVIEEHSHCHTEEHGGILKSAIHHTAETFMFLIIVMFALNTAIYFIGEETLGKFLMGGSVLQPLFAGIVGLIPNCAASVVIAQLYAQNTISFGSAIAGLSAGSGMGLLLLFRADIDKAECLKIAATLFSVSVLTGIAVQFLVG
ncbi:MAG: arsenic efflux protein, partial [Clostridiales bacterium]|nr:arsenic efflux protein [Candidatus Coliplasma equi]